MGTRNWWICAEFVIGTLKKIFWPCDTQMMGSGPDPVSKCHLTSVGITIGVKRWSNKHFISTMGFPILVRWHLDIESYDVIRNGRWDVANSCSTYTVNDSAHSYVTLYFQMLPKQEHTPQCIYYAVSFLQNFHNRLTVYGYISVNSHIFLIFNKMTFNTFQL